MERQINSRILQKYDSNGNFSESEGVLLKGEIAIGTPDGSNNKTTLRIGDGATACKNLTEYEIVKSSDMDNIDENIEAINFTTNIDLLTGSWTLGSGASLYTLTATVEGIDSSSNPMVSLIIHSDDTLADIYADQKEYSKICAAETGENTITFYATEKPIRSLPVMIKGK